MFNLQNVDYRPGKNSNEVWLCCPFCVQRGTSPDTRYRLGLNLSTGQAQCFNCLWKSRGPKTFELLKQYIQLGAATWEEKPSEVRPKEKILPEDFELLDGADDDFAQVAREYLTSRGVTEGQIKRKRVGYCIGGEYGYRVIFPVWSVERKLTAFVGRDWTGTQYLRYKNSSGSIEELYNAHLLGQFQRVDTLVLVEGIFDCLAVERASFNCCGQLGRVLRDKQAEIVKRFGFKTVVHLLDWDPDGVKSGLDNAATLSSSTCRVFVARPMLGKDTGQMTPEEIVQAVGKSRGPYSPGLKQEILMQFEREWRML